ncbi:MAG TPA: hypothetical protein ENH90_02160 [bacterium]|nr:hypothetical protein [bacterium]
MVEELYKKFEQKRAEVLKQPEFKEKELTPEQHKEILKEGVSKRIKTAQPVPPAQEQVVVSSVQQIKIEPKERQIQLLTDLAFEKGIPHAVEVAKRLENAYLLDEFHDALVDKLYNKLIEEGKLKQI